jgi:hypothetical protein
MPTDMFAVQQAAVVTAVKLLNKGALSSLLLPNEHLLTVHKYDCAWKSTILQC